MEMRLCMLQRRTNGPSEGALSGPYKITGRGPVEVVEGYDGFCVSRGFRSELERAVVCSC